ncbi:hypothetical protein ACSIGC_05355 [Tenacibaculum sp. ZS6-P6]|uniref:hypothetical protein n=1 Tax=Tenacibaculum sp. ZS6-P6 TaxID=3447503 RepID=UPI003F95ECA8
MNYTAFWKYYVDVNFLNFVFSLVLFLSSSLFWAIINFSTFGVLIGYWGFHLFKENEYYMYYNLGFTKRKLLSNVFLFNWIFILPVLLILLVIK